MRTGRASRFAFDPVVVVAFLDDHTTTKAGGNPWRTRRYINGLLVGREACVIRRWRHHAEGLTLQGVTRVLGTFNLSLTDLQAWATARGLRPVQRGTLPR